jgi:hypothetical protein
MDNDDASILATRTDYTLTGRCRIEGTQRGYMVTVRAKGAKGVKTVDLAHYVDYDAAQSTAKSVDTFGQYVGRRNGGLNGSLLFRVKGRRLTILRYRPSAV